MKKINSVLLGLSFALATAGLTFAAQTAAPATGTTAPVAKKHVKKNKKAAKPATDAAAKPASAPAAAK